MATINTLARPYAKAAFEFASAAKQSDAWSNMLALAAAFVDSPEVTAQLRNPALTWQRKAEFLAELCAERIDESFRNFVVALRERSPGTAADRSRPVRGAQGRGRALD